MLTVAIPPINGLIKEKTSDINMGYTWVEIFFVALSLLGFLVHFMVYIWDVRTRGNLL